MSTAFAFDLETTSNQPGSAYPVQICVVHHDFDSGSSRILMNTLVRPGALISPEATAVHGITDRDVVSAPDYAFIAWQVNLLVREMAPDYVVHFNGDHFDIPIIDRCLGGPVFAGAKSIDVLTLARRYFPAEPSHKLGELHLSLLNKPLVGAHDASADVLGMLELLGAMLPKIGLPLEKLANELREPKPWAVLPLGKFRGRLRSEVPRSWAEWMRDNATDMSGDLRATVDAILAGA